MSTQRALFDAPEQLRRLVELGPAPAPRARRADPVSSHVAADVLEASGALREQQRAVLLAVAAHRARTSKDLAEVAGLDRYLCARRLPELRDMGLCSAQKWTGGCLWWLTARGREVVAALRGET